MLIVGIVYQILLFLLKSKTIMSHWQKNATLVTPVIPDFIKTVKHLKQHACQGGLRWFTMEVIWGSTATTYERKRQSSRTRCLMFNCSLKTRAECTCKKISKKKEKNINNWKIQRLDITKKYNHLDMSMTIIQRACRKCILTKSTSCTSSRCMLDGTKWCTVCPRDTLVLSLPRLHWKRHRIRKAEILRDHLRVPDELVQPAAERSMNRRKELAKMG